MKRLDELCSFIHGCDYNPEQWKAYPDVLKKDIELMKKANINCVSIGIFSWSSLEVSENKYDFEWLDEVIDNLYINGIYTFLATPSGSKPHWMAQKYPEVLRVSAARVKNLPGDRHNHCYTSPVYRQKVANINRLLSLRYKDNPAVLLWHVSNEYSGECHCELCQHAFREWLKNKYTSLDKLNEQWWTTFWGHTFTDWEQIQSPAMHGEMTIHGLTLDWKRFVTYQTVDFFKHECKALREFSGDIPVTTNLMGCYPELNYFKFKDEVDIISWDSYPNWNSTNNYIDEVIKTASIHDLMRSIRKQPFLLMESTPSTTNWQPVARLKRPGVHMAEEMQAIAHGANSVQYFQWRKGRGCCEKFHGAVVDHYGEADTRVFKEVSEVGTRLSMLRDVYDATTKSEVAIIFDWENRWGIELTRGVRNDNMKYHETVISHYKAFWEQGVSVDFVDMEQDISHYKLVVAPMLYMLRGNIGDKIKSFVANGGVFVTTYFSGMVNENDLCYIGGAPGEIGEVLGIRAEEIDSISDEDENSVLILQECGIKLTKSSNDTSHCYKIKELCEIIHCSTATPLAVYQQDFYKGMPAITVNKYGNGDAYYLAARIEDKFNSDFYKAIIMQYNISRSIQIELPYGVTATKRTKAGVDYIFLQNYNRSKIEIKIIEAMVCVETGNIYTDSIMLNPIETKVLITKHS